MNTTQLLDLVIDAVEDLKGSNIQTLDVKGVSSVTDFMVVADANSTRQVSAIARHVVEKAKSAGQYPLGVEGENDGEWVLVDLGDVIVHIMQPGIRDFYQLEKLWSDMRTKLAQAV